jgi:adenylyl-sulfate kinase
LFLQRIFLDLLRGFCKLTQSIVWHDHRISRAQRAALKRQRPCLLWFTGLSGSGKSTIANALDVALHHRGYHTFLLDGDNVRHGLNRDLGFSDADRVENIRRVGEVSKLFADAGLIVISAFISPFASERLMVRQLFPEGEFVEVYMETPLETCEQRDPKGLYKKARAGAIRQFTGIDSPYESPRHPEVRLDTAKLSVDQCVDTLTAYLTAQRLIVPLGAAVAVP